jgi:uncharacterized protein
VRSVLALALTLAACAAAPPPPPAAATAASSAPAKHFSMHMYQVAFLSPGPRHIAGDTPERKKLLEGHQANIRRLAAEGKLLIAGPLDWPAGDKNEMVGIFIFDVPTKEEAETLCRTDPTIAAGHFAALVVPWYGPSGLTYDGQAEELAKIRAGSATTPTLPQR